MIGVAMLALGIAIGWIAKPDSARTPDTAQGRQLSPMVKGLQTAATDAPPPPGKRSIRPQKDESETPSPAVTEQVQSMQDNMTKSLVDRQKSKFETRIDQLKVSLSLTDSQQATLTRWLEAHLNGLQSMNIGDPDSMAKMPGLLEDFNVGELEKQLEGSMNADQQAALAGFREREHRNQVDSRALKNLAKLQSVVQFEEGQREEVYKLLSDGAEESLQSESGNTGFGSIFNEAMGVETDPYDLGLQQAMTAAMTDAGKASDSPPDQAGSVKQIREIINARIEAKVEKLRDVLNDRQLDAYRNELKTNGLGVFGGVLNSMEAASGRAPEN